MISYMNFLKAEKGNVVFILLELLIEQEEFYHMLVCIKKLDHFILLKEHGTVFFYFL